ncbi:hypothetical protein GCM10022626_12480 [[Pseudomonas] carboxydohydrogena]
MFLMALPEIPPQQPARRPDPDFKKTPFMGIFGFSAIGLLLCLILTRMPISRTYMPLEICLLCAAGPLAAWLGFSLGGGE